MILQGPKYSPQKSRPLESGHRRHGVCIAIECSYKLDQKNELKFLCELCTFSQIRSHILRGSCKLPIPPILRESFQLATPPILRESCKYSAILSRDLTCSLLKILVYGSRDITFRSLASYTVQCIASANSTRILQQEFHLAISTEPNCVVHS